MILPIRFPSTPRTSAWLPTGGGPRPRILLWRREDRLTRTRQQRRAPCRRNEKTATYLLDVSFGATYAREMSPKSENDDISLEWHPSRPYQALPPLPPREDLETKAILKGCIGARSALAALDQAAQLIPNPRMLIRTLPVLEAQASSEIENIFTTTDRLFRHLSADATADPSTKEALRYREALMVGVDSLATRPLCTRTAEEVCSRIKGTKMRVRPVPGTALVLQATGDVVYTPPVGEQLLRDKLANWEGFLHERTDLDPLVRMAVGHYQFEAIHPFVDGNGRTGRVLNSLFLIEEKLLTLPVLYLSRYIIRSKSAYYELLLEVTRDQAWEPWVLYLLQAVKETAAWTTAKISAIRNLAAHTADFVRERRPKIYSLELVNTLFEQPYCRIAHLVDAGIAQRQAASRYLAALADLGVLREHRVGRDKLFVHTKLMQLLTDDIDEVEPYG
jgi:Fic family protein